MSILRLNLLWGVCPGHLKLRRNISSLIKILLSRLALGWLAWLAVTWAEGPFELGHYQQEGEDQEVSHCLGERRETGGGEDGLMIFMKLMPPPTRCQPKPGPLFGEEREFCRSADWRHWDWVTCLQTWLLDSHLQARDEYQNFPIITKCYFLKCSNNDLKLIIKSKDY